MALQHLRSSTAHKRPIPTVMSAGQIAINTNETSPALFFKDSNGDLVKVGPVHIGTSAPNSSPASVAATALVTGTVYQILTVGDSDFTLVGASANTVGTIFTATGTTTGTGTVSGQQGVEKGEMWLDTTGGTYVLKIYDGSAWRSESGTFVDSAGDTMTGDLVMNNANIVFEGATADDFETTLTVTDPTADRTITLPNVTGTVVTTGDTGTVTSTMISDGTIVNADVNGSAAIAGTKIDPDFGSQTVETTGVFSAAGGAAATPSIAFTGDLNTGIYSPGADQVAVATNGTERMRINSSGNIGIGGSAPNYSDHKTLSVFGAANNGAGFIQFTDTSGNADGAIFVDDGNLFINADYDNTSSSSTIRFRVDGSSERMRIDSSGRVGIGTSDADELLHVANTGGGASILLETNNSSGGNILFGDADSNTVGRVQYLHSDNSMRLHTAGSESMQIDSSGRLLVGTTTEGAVNADTLTVAESGDSGITIRSGSANAGSLFFSDATSGTAEYAAYLQYDHSSNNLAIGTASTERMRIDSSGNVGIGGSPSSFSNQKSLSLFAGSSTVARFDFYNSDGSTREAEILSYSGNNESLRFGGITNRAMTFHTNNSERMRIDSSGNVGIGTTSPQALSGYTVLTLNNSSQGGAIEFKRSNTSYGRLLQGSSAVILETKQNIPLIFGTGTSSTERMRIDSSGRLLVGTTTEGYAGAETFTIANAFNAGITIRTGTGSNGSLAFSDGTSGLDEYRGLIQYRHADNSLNFFTNGSQRMSLASSGLTQCTFISSENYVIVGTEQGGTTVNAAIDRATNGNGTNAVYIGTSQIQVTSDIRLKHNIGDTSLNATEKINQIEIFDFDWNDPRDNEWKNCRGRWTGFSAQQVQPILPFCINAPRDEVTREILHDDPSDWVVDPTGFIPVLVKALQEANAKIETLEQRLTDAGIA